MLRSRLFLSARISTLFVAGDEQQIFAKTGGVISAFQGYMRRKVIAAIQARMGSMRLPGKALKKIQGRTIIAIIAERLRAAKELDGIILAIPNGEENDPLMEEGRKIGIPVVRGSERDIVSRLLKAAKHADGTEAIVRITGDCPFVDPETVDSLIRKYRKNSSRFDFFTNGFPLTFPIGMDCDILPVPTLEKLNRTLDQIKDRENFVTYIMARPEIFRISRTVNYPNLSYIRLTLDYPEDFRLIKTVYKELYPQKRIFTMTDIIKLFRKNPLLSAINKNRIDSLELQRK